MAKVAVKNAADPKQVKAAKLSERFVIKREIEDINAVLSVQQGRRFVWGLLDACGIHARTYDRGQAVVHDTIFLEGRRSIGVELLQKILEAAPESYFTMLKERKDEVLHDRKARGNKRTRRNDDDYGEWDGDGDGDGEYFNN